MSSKVSPRLQWGYPFYKEGEMQYTVYIYHINAVDGDLLLKQERCEQDQVIRSLISCLDLNEASGTRLAVVVEPYQAETPLKGEGYGEKAK